MTIHNTSRSYWLQAGASVHSHEQSDLRQEEQTWGTLCTPMSGAFPCKVGMGRSVARALEAVQGETHVHPTHHDPLGLRV